MFKKLFNLNYHPQLINIMVKGNLSGAFIVNILTPTLLAFAFYEYIASSMIYMWLALNYLLFMLRMLIVKKIEKALEIALGDMSSYIYLVVTVISATSLLYAYGLFYTYLYVPDLELFFMAILTLSMIAGAMATLVGIYHAFAAYIIINSLPIVVIFAYHGGRIFEIFAFTTFIFMFVMLKNGYKQHMSFRELIELKDSFEVRVKDSTLKLEQKNKQLNDSIREIKEKENLLYHQSKLAQMGEMLSMIAHQWRQPLLAISATSSSLSLKATLEKADTQVIIKMTDDINVHVQHLSETIDDFRNFFKPDKKSENTNYCEIVKSVLLIVETTIRSKNIEIILDLHCQSNFRSFSNELKQVILNLLKNAEDVLVEKKVLKPFIKISTFKSEDEKLPFTLEISDNAGGIPADIIDKIFDPYFSTKLEKNGSGLGLYMSKTIIQEHCKGKLEVHNIDDGALFRVCLGDIL